MATRAEFLQRIRTEVRRTPGLFPASSAARPARPAEAALAVRRQLSERWPQALERFIAEFQRISGVFHRVGRLEDVADVIRVLAREKQASELITWDLRPLGIDFRSSPELQGLSVAAALRDGGAEARQRYLEAAPRAQIGVTGADFALAETGTLILISGAGRPRSTSLLPETHVAIFGKDQLLETLEQMGVMLEALHVNPAGAMSGAVINFITGPSRTADIELTLTRGVHGPKEIHAIFVESL
jgi:L-lactate dehydrogenase complex protein LldG